jgi:hypothetical protein
MREMVREILSPTFFAELTSLGLFMAMLFVWGVATGVIG